MRQCGGHPVAAYRAAYINVPQEIVIKEGGIERIAKILHYSLDDCQKVWLYTSTAIIGAKGKIVRAELIDCIVLKILPFGFLIEHRQPYSFNVVHRTVVVHHIGRWLETVLIVVRPTDCT